MLLPLLGDFFEIGLSHDEGIMAVVQGKIHSQKK
jgi:hypothetical protein